LLVKSASEDASFGISDASIVYDFDHLIDRVNYIHSSTSTDALVETFIEGRELYVGIIGNRQLKVYPTWEMIFENAKPGDPRIATSRVKWDVKHQNKLGIKTERAQGIPRSVENRIKDVCTRAYKALSLSGYARIDLRLRDDGEIFLIEANPNPNLSFGEDFAESAESIGIGYDQLLKKIISLGLGYQAEWRLV
jgi:D-alanine-D-alanine ligase